MGTESKYDVDILRRIEDTTLNDQELARDMGLVSGYKMKNSEIRTFFSGKIVFITGATGFLGKTLLEKLMRTCCEIEKFYILVRMKKNKTPEERINEVLDDPVFQVLKKEQPKFRSKIEIIPGNIAVEGLGISKDCLTKLQAEVSVIFHLAATVRFDEALKTAVDFNIKGTIEMLKFAKKCEYLEAFVHVSTAFSNCNLTNIDERLYTPPVKASTIIGLMESLQEEQVKKITPILLGEFPNTYTYTKAITEDAVAEYGKGLPICIFRPSIVSTTYREPIAGWTDNAFGPAGAVLASGVGLLRVMHGDQTNRADIVPIDYVTAAIVAAACRQAKLTKQQKASQEVVVLPIYNYVSGPQNPLTWQNYMNYCSLHGSTMPTKHAIWYYWFFICPNYPAYLVYAFLLHTLPALLVDGVRLAIGRKPKMLKIYKKIHKFNDVLKFFVSKQWTFKNYNTRMLYEELNHADKQLFKFDIENLDWDMYCQNHIAGIRVYMLKDPSSTIPQALIKWGRLYILHQTVRFGLSVCLLAIIWCIFSYIFL